MIKSITVKNHLNETINLSLTDPWDTGLVIKQIDGLGPPKATINATDLAMGDGAVYNSARTDKRNIVMHFQFIETWTEPVYSEGGDTVVANRRPSFSFPVEFGRGVEFSRTIIRHEGEVIEPSHVDKTIEDVRLETYKYFPLKKNVTLTFVTDKRVAYISGYVESNSPDIFSKEEGCQISIVCPNPYFESPIKPVALNGVRGLFEFPFSFDAPISFGEIESDSRGRILYEGDVDTGTLVIINATGGASGVSIANLSNGDYLTIDTSKIGAITGGDNNLKAGDRIMISSVTGKKYATLYRNARTYNILPCIAKDTSWLNLVRGINEFQYTASEGASNISISVDAKTLYEGI